MRAEAFYVLNGSNENSKCKTQDSDDINPYPANVENRVSS